ncbi:FCH and double SH3 domains protein 2 [Fasciola hepatica]|uniref:FCH and double SH3 domains protein 2 n=1 Tax=Fasciola hepatica TaxID=6192 RepID=A0A4E0RBL8_FASHE|nr:FCH and double SH3 domains protein 2 [Fasciola hepatica]
MYSVQKKTTKPLTQLKYLHNEHFSRLQMKHTAESDLLDDVRLYCKLRAAIERDYGQALQKLTSGFLSKKELVCALSNDEEHEHSIWRVWRLLLEESNNLALSRIRASEAQQRLYSELKPLKMQRTSVSKRVLEQLRVLQGDLAACVQEMAKSHKVYVEEEKQAQETRMKTVATEEKIRRRSTNFFHSMAQLHRNYEKLLVRRQAYDARSATARNEYLFQLAAINAHLKHYFKKDLPSLAKTLDGELYEKLSAVFSALGQQESELCTQTNECFSRISRDALKISRTFAWNVFLKSCPLFDKAVQYQFEPLEGDQNTLLRSSHSKEASLEQIARKLARRLVLRERRIKSYEVELKTLQAGCVALHPNVRSLPGSPDQENSEDLLAFNQEYVEHKVEEVQFAIRREEIERVKIEACLSLLRNSSVEVKQFIVEARAAADAAAAMAQQMREAGGDMESIPGLVSSSQSLRPSVRPSGEGSSDSVDSSSGPVRQAGYNKPFEPQYMPGFSRSGYEYNQQNEKWTTTTNRPATIGQVSGRPSDSRTKSIGLDSLDGSSKSVTWSLFELSQASSSSHDYQNMNNIQRDFPRRTVDDCAVRSGRRAEPIASGTHPKRGASSDALHEDAEVDLESVWSEKGRLRQATVLHEFRAKRPDEVDLVVHETVVLLEKTDKDGWIKVRSLIDGNEGVVPINYLRLHGEPKLTEQNTSEFPIETSGHNEPPPLGLPDEQNLVPDRLEFCENYGSTSSNNTNDQLSIQPMLDPEKRSHSSSSATIRPSYESKVHRSTDEKVARISPLRGSFVRTLIEFEGSNADELTFSAGSVIRVTGRAPVPVNDRNHVDENGFRSSPVCSQRFNATAVSTVDDGWWEGELIVPPDEASAPNQTYRIVRGVFPSMLVQSIPQEDYEHWERIWECALSVESLRNRNCDFLPACTSTLTQTQSHCRTVHFKHN